MPGASGRSDDPVYALALLQLQGFTITPGCISSEKRSLAPLWPNYRFLDTSSCRSPARDSGRHG
jgi:hypothetical protein